MDQPFRPDPNKTVNIDVSGTSQRVLITADACNSVEIRNDGTATVWLAFGDSTITTTANTGAPTGAGVEKVYRYKNKSGAALYVSAIAAGATGKIYFSPGDGI